MLLQHAMIQRLRHLCQEDKRLVAAMLYGSFTHGEGDQFSDIDTFLFFADGRLPEIDQCAWVRQIAPVELYYVNEFGNSVAIFDNLVRAEFHFDPAADMPKIQAWRSHAWFPSLEGVILADKTGQLAHHLSSVVGPSPPHNTAEDALYLCHSSLNWWLMGVNVLQRGETARALEVMTLVHDQLLRMARILEDKTEHWLTPTKALENELSPAAYRCYQTTTAPADPAALRQAYRAAWEWGNELMAALARRFSIELPATLLQKLHDRLPTS